MACSYLSTKNISILSLILSLFSCLVSLCLCVLTYKGYTINKIQLEPFFRVEISQIFDSKSNFYRNTELRLFNDGNLSSVSSVRVLSFLCVEKKSDIHYSKTYVPINYFDSSYMTGNLSGLISHHFGYDNNLTMFNLEIESAKNGIYFIREIVHYVYITYKIRLEKDMRTVVINKNSLIEERDVPSTNYQMINYRDLNYSKFIDYLETNNVFK